MIEEFINNVSASVVIIDGVYFVPFGLMCDELLPLLFAFSMLLGLLPSIGWRVGQGLATLVEWFIDWLRFRKAVKASESSVIDPQILEALDKVDPDVLLSWYKYRTARKTE